MAITSHLHTFPDHNQGRLSCLLTGLWWILLHLSLVLQFLLHKPHSHNRWVVPWGRHTKTEIERREISQDCKLFSNALSLFFFFCFCFMKQDSIMNLKIPEVINHTKWKDMMTLLHLIILHASYCQRRVISYQSPLWGLTRAWPCPRTGETQTLVKQQTHFHDAK